MTRDAGAPPPWPVAGSGDNATAVGLYSAIVTALYRREGTGKGSYVTTSLLAEGAWSAKRFAPGRAMRGEVLRTARPKESRQRRAECVSSLGWGLVRAHRHARQVGRSG